MATATDISVVHAPEQHRYEAREGGAGGPVAGFADYIRTPQLVVFTHTEVDPAHEGRGVGSAIARAALDDVRAQGLPVLPLCPFFAGWIARHRDYADLAYHAPPSRVTD